MEGSIIIDFGTGWACSNDVTFIVEKDLVKKADGTQACKHTNTLRVMSYHNVIGGIKKNDKVECVFKIEESGAKKAYTAEVNGITPEMMILKILSTTDNQQEIIKKIKGGYNYGK